MFSFLLSMCNRNIYFQTIEQHFVVHSFGPERKRQVVIEQTRFLSTVFLCSEFKLENIYSGVNSCVKNVLFEGTFFCGSLEISQKLEPAKISCHTVCTRLFLLIHLFQKREKPFGLRSLDEKKNLFVIFELH